MRNQTVGILFMVIIVASILVVMAPAAVADHNPPGPEPWVIYVPDDYAKIQWAVDNASAGDTIIVREGMYTENIIVNTPYLTIRSENGADATIVSVASSYDDSFEISADYVNINGFTVGGKVGGTGIDIHDANYCEISNNSIHSFGVGIRLHNSSNNLIVNNNCSKNGGQGGGWGIHLGYSSCNNILNNNISNNRDGINLGHSPNNYIVDNSIYTYFNIYSEDGISLDDSPNTVIVNNCINSDIDNRGIGIHIGTSSNINISDNRLINAGIYLGISGASEKLSYYNTHIIENNTINGRPIYYYKNKSNIRAPEDAGSVILANCTGIIVENINSSFGTVGIELAYTKNSTISNNEALSNTWGIYLYQSSNNNISSNEISNNIVGIYPYKASNNNITDNNISNSYVGLRLSYSGFNDIVKNKVTNSFYGTYLSDESDNNVFCCNNFENNTNNVHSEDSTNTWNSTKEITYTYNGSEFENYLGNYWDDYADTDVNGDGIWDNPYSIDGDQDYYPLKERFENYIMQETERIYGIPVDFRFANNLRKGNNHPEVRYLQIVLNTDPDSMVTTSGDGSPSNETTHFGSSTENAVKRFQEKYATDILEPLGLTSGTGFVGEKTRKKLNDILDQNFTEDYKEKFGLLNETERKSAIWSYINESYKDYGLPEDFPKELILAIATQETGKYAHWNNEHVADDWGRGIMQITTNTYVGAGGVDSNSDDCIKCRNREGKIYCSRYYSNTPKGAEANVKDGLYALSDKYQQVNKDKIQPPEGYTTQEMTWISAVQRYNTFSSTPTLYILNIGDKLAGLANGEYGQFDGFDTQVANSLSEKFKDAYSESIRLYSPGELRVYDSYGNVTGLVNGEVREEIPNSIYDNVTKTVIIFSSYDYYYEVVGTDTGTYGLNMVSVENEKETDFSITNVSTTTNATHQYLINWTAYSQGEEGVTLKIDSDGDGIFEETITIQPPIARFTYSPEDPAVNQGITFNASGSYDADGVITNYEWDFGDGNTTSTAEPILTHFYTLADDYDVILTVTDNDGATNSTSKIITVYPPTAIFDTGSPANPYPSIMGNHTGTIKPNHTVIATKLYTYPCEGTGGHTEYAEIQNLTWNATATWEGYVGDWHNITFDKTVVLLANETYNYTIRTGSYPQIHHNRTLLTANGWINSTEFVDVNGKKYTNWIPAIRLWA